jgi:DNA-binding transcriptional LysR family regulator
VVDLLATNNILDLNRRDADVAIRPTRQPEANLVGRRLCDVEFGVFAAPQFLAGMTDDNIFSERWIGFTDTLLSTPVGAWFDTTIPAANICLRCDSFVAIRIAAESGMGLALLPGFLGDASQTLLRLEAPTRELTTGLWILTHPDLARSARVHAFVDHFSAALGSS